MKPEFAPFIAAVCFSLLVWGALSRRYIAPWLEGRPLHDAAEPILYLHLFRFVGLAFLMPGVVNPALSPAWAFPAAFGDLIAALLAAAALALRETRMFLPALWLFSLVGASDLLRAFATGQSHDVPAHLQAAIFIPILGVPPLLWTHVLLMAIMVKAMRAPAPKSETMK